MEDIQLLDAVERYLRGEMNSGEILQFEQLRKSNPEVDQLVVEQTIFLSQLADFGDRKHYRSHLHEIHNQLLAAGDIKEEAPRAKVVEMVKKYRRVWAVAASIAGIIAITISGLVVYFTPDYSKPQLQQLSKEIYAQKKILNALKNDLNTKEPKAPVNATIKFGGTGFLIDGKGYLVTNAHVVKDAKTILVQSKGQDFKSKLVQLDIERDIAILKIEDSDFKPFSSLPYGFKKSGADLGEPIFTLGFPRDEIVYGEGYLSANTGFNEDTMSFQITVAANPGNSGGPVFNKNGEVVGIISTRQLQTQGFVFAVRAKNIFKTIDDLKKDTSYQNLKLNTNSSVKTLERPQQIKKIEDCVFLVKAY
jgi:serine protease Do